MGSRILSRSFTLGKWEREGEAVEGPESSQGIGEDIDTDMDVHEEPSESGENIPTERDDIDIDDEEDSSDIAMVPMADMLNARYGSENVRPSSHLLPLADNLIDISQSIC